jgi:hypothetical protein
MPPASGRSERTSGSGIRSRFAFYDYLAAVLGRSTDPTWGSLKLIEECLVGAGVDHEDAGRILDPLRTLHELRTVVKGHAAPEKRRELEKQASTAYGSFRAHFADLAAGCDDALDAIMGKLGTT